tara:strand:- start:263 stop:487 length:225 start_codon:yes stop_codon:yes gene_type:complete
MSNHTNTIHKYYQTLGELINHYVPNDDNEPFVQALIHAYELGAMHHSEEWEDYELAEFDSSWEQENSSWKKENN